MYFLQFPSRKKLRVPVCILQHYFHWSIDTFIYINLRWSAETLMYFRWSTHTFIYFRWNTETLLIMDTFGCFFFPLSSLPFCICQRWNSFLQYTRPGFLPFSQLPSSSLHPFLPSSLSFVVCFLLLLPALFVRIISDFKQNKNLTWVIRIHKHGSTKRS